MTKILTRYGDGSAVELTESELMEDLIAGTEDAADRGNIPVMTQDDLNHLADIFKCTHRVVGVDPGYECVLSYDGAPIKMLRTTVTADRLQALMIYEKLMGADTLEMGFVDYSYKPIKPILTFEEPLMEQALLMTTAPIMYGAQPNLGRYSQPDGPFPNPAELMPMGKIKEAQESYELAVEEAIKDMVDVASSMYESGVDCILLDTVGAAGDADALAGLMTAEILRKKYPDIGIEMGMAGEFVLGMHGALEYDGVRLAGLYNHQMLELAQKAGVNIFGTVMNTSTTESTPWNIARAVTFTKACSDIAKIPIHANIGMGVGGVTVHDHTPIDVTSRASKALVELCNLDGLQVGVGDPLGMAVTHALASGMGGMRAAGDLVARMQIQGMRLVEAKAYVAQKLGVAVKDLTDPIIMTEVRTDLKLGTLHAGARSAKGIEAKHNIANILDIDINCVKNFKKNTAPAG